MASLTCLDRQRQAQNSRSALLLASHPVLLRASEFPDHVVHGFSTRRGGVSEGRYASMNLGGRWGDRPEHVAENLRLLADAGGYDPATLVRVRQVHGDAIVAAHQVDHATEADAIWQHVDHPGQAVIGVMTADCVPVLIVDRAGTVAAAIHSGWRGTAANIAGQTAELLRREGGRDLLAAIGPCIEVDAFEVGEEVAERFDAAFVQRSGHAKPHVDLVGCVRSQLEAAGISANQIERVGGCTHANPDWYFSYRRDGAGIGQQLSFVGVRRVPRDAS